MSGYPIRLNQFSSDRGVHGHYFEFLLAQDATLSPTTNPSTLGGGFLPGGMTVCPPASASANLTFTLPTGSAMDTAFPDMLVGDSFQYSFVNQDASKTITIASGSNFGVTGHNSGAANGLVAAGSEVVYEISKLSAGVWDCWRVLSRPASY